MLQWRSGAAIIQQSRRLSATVVGRSQAVESRGARAHSATAARARPLPPMLQPMDTGDAVPDFELPDQTGTPRRLRELLKDGPVVLFFYPAAMTYGCTKESCHFRDLKAEFDAVGAQRVGISADPVEKQKRFADKHDFDYPAVVGLGLLGGRPVRRQAFRSPSWGRTSAPPSSSAPISGCSRSFVPSSPSTRTPTGPSRSSASGPPPPDRDDPASVPPLFPAVVPLIRVGPSPRGPTGPTGQ